MSADFWSGYVSGAAGILIGNPLDLIKTRIQAGKASASPDPSTAALQPQAFKSHFDRASTLVRGVTAPILGYGALNAILFVTYNRSLEFMGDAPAVPNSPFKVWCAGATGGMATFVVSAPTELIKCRAQVASGNVSSWSIARETWKSEGIRGLYYGGCITSIRDAVGYGFYFWAYERSKQAISSPHDTDREAAFKVLLCGGLAGVMTWTSIFPLDVIKTRMQTQILPQPTQLNADNRPLLQTVVSTQGMQSTARLSTLAVARSAYQSEGMGVFFRGLTICSVRAFVVNAIQWIVYETMMKLLQPR